MHKTRSALHVAALALAAASLPSSAHADDAIAAVPDHVQAQVRWIKAERDKSNALHAQDFIRPESLQAKPDGAATLAPDGSDPVSGKTD